MRGCEAHARARLCCGRSRCAQWPLTASAVGATVGAAVGAAVGAVVGAAVGAGPTGAAGGEVVGAAAGAGVAGAAATADAWGIAAVAGQPAKPSKLEVPAAALGPQLAGGAGGGGASGGNRPREPDCC